MESQTGTRVVQHWRDFTSSLEYLFNSCRRFGANDFGRPLLCSLWASSPIRLQIAFSTFSKCNWTGGLFGQCNRWARRFELKALLLVLVLDASPSDVEQQEPVTRLRATGEDKKCVANFFRMQQPWSEGFVCESLAGLHSAYNRSTESWCFCSSVTYTCLVAWPSAHNPGNTP